MESCPAIMPNKNIQTISIRINIYSEQPSFEVYYKTVDLSTHRQVSWLADIDAFPKNGGEGVNKVLQLQLTVARTVQDLPKRTWFPFKSFCEKQKRPPDGTNV